MNANTGPKQLAKKDDLVIIPKKEYQEFSKWKQAVRVRLDERWFWTPKWQKKEAEAEEAIRAGKIVGPFSDYKKLLSALKRKRK